MKNLIQATAFAVGTLVAGAALASPIPAVTGSYVGTYDLDNVFTSGGNLDHGLYLPGLLGDRSWQVQSGTAGYSASGSLNLSGEVKQTYNGNDFFLDFNFSLVETNDHPNGLICGGNSAANACQNATQQMKDNIVFFDMGANGIMGTITGKGALAGLDMEVIMRPLDDPNRKPGQLGFGGNWYDQEFGYSNWLSFNVLSGPTNAVAGLNTGNGPRNGDVNLNFKANGDPAPSPVPLPAGLPLLLAGMGAFAFMRRRATA